jgi:cytochrome bd-type quinol oxidase subunit 2
VRRALATIVAGSCVYGFSIGSVHGPRLAAANLVKFPALLLVTALVCAAAYHAFALLVTRRLTFDDTTRLSLRTFADLAVLLASLAPVSLFLAWTVVQPTETSLEEYPLFLGLNVLFIAAAGAVALVRQARRLTRDRGLRTRRAAAVVAAWLAVSLFTGGQCAWFMRPFFGPSTIRDPPFMEGTNPDYRGATSFYEAVAHLVTAPPLPRGWHRR